MNKTSRRSFLRTLSAVPLVGAASFPYIGCTSASGKPTDIAVGEVGFDYEDYKYRTPIKFGGQLVTDVTLLNAKCTVRSANGKTANGFASMPMGYTWSYPSEKLDAATRLNAMKSLAQKISKLTSDYKETGHPVDINVDLEPHYLKAADEVSREMKLADPIPKLCTLVVASPFDAAIHDAFGKLHGVSCYHTYGPEFMRHDLSHYLGAEFKGEYLGQYIEKEPKPRMPLYHLVGAVDPIEAKDIQKRIDDGLPETLPEWIHYNGLTHIKIKLNGEDLKWDVDRVVHVDRVAAETQKKRGVSTWYYSCDFNEKCPNVDYLLAFLKHIKEKTPAGFERIQYIEQPTKRDLKADRANVMHEAAKLRPVVIDESLTEMEALLMAREMGYTGAALKACKGQTQATLMAAAAQKFKMFLCVQDLTCPGASLIHSAGLAAHIPGVAAIEGNSRQYVPIANKPWEAKFPGIFVIKDGTIETGVLNKPGLSAVA